MHFTSPLMIHRIGLSYLAVRHVQMGEMRHADVLRHLRILSDMLPTSFSFAYRAGYWALDTAVFDPNAALPYLYSAVHGNASHDASASSDEKIAAQRDLARAYAAAGQVTNAQRELLQLLQRQPADFGIAFILRETLSEETSEELKSSIDNALRVTDSIYTTVLEKSHGLSNAYSGFRLPRHGVYAPSTLYSSPNEEEFKSYVVSRTPLKVEFDSTDELTLALSWPSDWSLGHLRDIFGSTSVEVERRPRTCPFISSHDSSDALLGFGMQVTRHAVPFADFANRLENTASGLPSTHVEYLNTQQKSKMTYSQPLNLISESLPLPSFIGEYIESVTDVNMWLGASPATCSSTSRLHMDATDNLYILLHGNKTFRIFSPDLATDMQTVSPTYAVAENGLSFRLTSPVKDFFGANDHFSVATSVTDEVIFLCIVLIIVMCRNWASERGGAWLRCICKPETCYIFPQDGSIRY